MKLKRCNAINDIAQFPTAPSTCLGITKVHPGDRPQIDVDIQEAPQSSSAASVRESQEDCSLQDSLHQDVSFSNMKISEGSLKSFKEASFVPDYPHCECHCKHQEHWAKETFRILLRIQDFLCQTSGRCSCKVGTSDDPLPNLNFPTTTDEINDFFLEINSNETKRLEVIKCVSKEVSPKLKKSVESILLRVAPPSAWVGYSKNGQRGKKSATNIGVPKFLLDCLRYSKVRAQSYTLL